VHSFKCHSLECYSHVCHSLECYSHVCHSTEHYSALVSLYHLAFCNSVKNHSDKCHEIVSNLTSIILLIVILLIVILVSVIIKSGILHFVQHHWDE
jgi:hypothetical protein